MKVRVRIVPGQQAAAGEFFERDYRVQGGVLKPGRVLGEAKTSIEAALAQNLVMGMIEGTYLSLAGAKVPVRLIWKVID